MAAFGSVATATNEDDADAITIGKPTGLAANDLMVAVLGVTQNVAFSLSGWTQLFSVNESGSTQQITALWKIAEAADAAASDFTFTHANTTTQSRVGALFRITGTFGGAGNLAYGADQVNGDATPSYTSGVIPPNSASLLLLGAWGTGAISTFSDYAITNNNPSWTERVEISKNGAEDCSLGIATGEYAAATTTGAATLTITSGTESVGFIVAISDSQDASISPAVITATATVVAPTVAANADVTVSAAIGATASVVAPTVTTGAALWKNTSKSTTVTFTNTDKS